MFDGLLCLQMFVVLRVFGLMIDVPNLQHAAKAHAGLLEQARMRIAEGML